MGHSWKNDSHLEKWLKLGRIRRIWKNESHSKNKIPFGNMSDLEKRVILKKKNVTR